MQWPAEKVQRVPVDDLEPYANNSRTHSSAQIDQLAKSIETWGFTIPVLIDDDKQIICGHGRVLAAKRLGLPEIPCITASGWTEDQKRAYVIADNKLAENAGWDLAILGAELTALVEVGFDPELVGYDTAAVDRLLAKSPVLPSVTEDLRPMKMTHILISVPNTADPSFLRDALAEVLAAGGKVDYAGN